MATPSIWTTQSSCLLEFRERGLAPTFVPARLSHSMAALNSPPKRLRSNTVRHFSFQCGSTVAAGWLERDSLVLQIKEFSPTGSMRTGAAVYSVLSVSMERENKCE